MHFIALIFSVTLGLVVGDDEPSTNYYYPAASNGLIHGAVRSQLSSIDSDEDPISILARNIPGGGVPGEDFPILSHVPDTGFDCKKQSSSGYFADVDKEALCQVFHICQEDGTIDSFLCPNGSIFNQQYFVCDWWFNVDCSDSEQYFRLNEEIGVVPEESQVTGRFDSLGLSYGAPNVGRNEKQNVVIQYEKANLDSSEDALQNVNAALSRDSQTTQRRDSSVNNLYQVPHLRESSLNQLYQAPEQRADITISQSYQSPHLGELSPNPLYQAPEQRKEDITISQSYQAPKQRNLPTLRDGEPLPQSYKVSLQNRRN